MTTNKIQGTEYVCNGCGRTQVVTENTDDLPNGFHISTLVFTYSSGGDVLNDVYACTVNCLVLAVTKFRDGE